MVLKHSFRVVLAGLTMAMLPLTARADLTYGFLGITNNRAEDAAVGRAQLSVTVSDYGAVAGVNRALFTFADTGPEQCSISEIYFDDGTLASISRPPQITASASRSASPEW